MGNEVKLKLAYRLSILVGDRAELIESRDMREQVAVGERWGHYYYSDYSDYSDYSEYSDC